MADVSLLVRSAIATSISNIDSSRFRNPSLEKRKEGWTEVWGCGTEADDADKDSLPHPAQLPLKLVQHRPAWLEQLVLRIAGIPHIVVNSPYAATEATGSLPYLIDTDPSSPVALVGQHDPSDPENSNSILHYLTTERNIRLDDDGKLTSPLQKSLAHLYTTLVTTQLEPALLSLRFGDNDAWEQVHREQYVRASSGATAPSLVPVGGWWQAWSVRVVALRKLKVVWTVKESLAIARRGYESLEAQLEGKTYLLGSSKPTTVDALLWSHLADSLCDVHLVTVLADFPNLVQYFQSIYDQYFRTPDVLNDEGKENWRVRNQNENARNPFQHLPIMEGSIPQKPSNFQDALELMQTLALHSRDLQQILTIAKEKRQQESRRTDYPTSQSTWHRWRMGGDLFPPADDDSSGPPETPAKAKWRQGQRHNDVLWIGGFITATTIALFLTDRRVK